MADEFVIVLRFDPKDASVLAALAERGRSEGLFPDQVGIFQRAADATRLGEPLRVVCSHPAEAQQMADGYALYGVARPAVEQVRF